MRGKFSVFPAGKLDFPGSGRARLFPYIADASPRPPGKSAFPPAVARFPPGLLPSPSADLLSFPRSRTDDLSVYAGVENRAEPEEGVPNREKSRRTSMSVGRGDGHAVKNNPAKMTF